LKTKYDNVFVNPTGGEIDPCIIAFDLDSVLNTVGHDIGRGIAKAFNVTYETARSVDPEYGYEKFHFEVPGVGYKEMSKVVNKIIMEESPSSLPSPFMASVLRYVYEVTGTPIQVVTARNPMTVGVTKRWLFENLDGIPFRAYLQHGVPKAVTLKMMKASIFVDDRHKTIAGLIDKIEYPVLYQRPWNNGRPIRLPVVEIRDLRDIIPLLNLKLGRVPMDWPSYIPFPKPEGERTTKKYATIL
jgi:hypothetical protein